MEIRFDPTVKHKIHGEVLRERAEDVVRTGSSHVLPMSEDIPKLVHELQVHHVELEMQNEELRQAQQTLAEACDHYTQLYDFSPAGYVTLTPDGLIVEANLRFCTMVGMPRKVVVQQPFQRFIAPQDWDLFRRHCLDVPLAPGTPQTCKLRLLPKDGPPLVMHVESVTVIDRDRDGVHIETAMLDMTQREDAEIALREAQRKVRETAARLVTAQDDERRRIARDLHDDHCQRVTAAILELAMLPKRHPAPWASPADYLKPVKAMLAGLLSDLRELSHDLHPDLLGSLDLDDAVRTLLADFTETTQIATKLQTTPEPLRLPPGISACLYRLVQESLANVRKHAKAKMVSVVVTGRPDVAELLITDDGQGFVPKAVDGLHHLGLLTMRERVEQLQGTFTVSSRPGDGTTISVQIPMSQD